MAAVLQKPYSRRRVSRRCWLQLKAALVLLAIAGYADVVSAVLRSTIVQLAVPDSLRGRMTGLHMALVTGAPRLGDLEAGAMAAGFGDTVSVVSGGLGCVAGALVIAQLMPGFHRQRSTSVTTAVPVEAAAAMPPGNGRDEHPN